VRDDQREEDGHLQYAVAWNGSRAPACGSTVCSTTDVTLASERESRVAVW
jgi:hypothetical protein